MPDSGAVEHAFAWIMKLFLQAASLPRPWLKPHIAVAPTGEVVFAWWYGAKTFTVYIGEPVSNAGAYSCFATAP